MLPHTNTQKVTMLGKRSRSLIGRLSDLLVSGSRSSLLDSYIDPFLRDRSENSPNPCRNDKSNNNNSSRNFDLGHHGVGLGIVVALEKSSLSFSSSSSSSSSGGGGGISTCSKYFVCSPRGRGRYEPDDGPAEEEEEDEDYTYVTFHLPRESFTRVYYDQIEDERSDVRDRDDDGRSVQGFLRSCQRCGKTLHGQDIYMFRGEKGFCSAECRSAQIIMDEQSEQCRSEVAAADAWSYSSSSAYTEGQIFSTSILAV